MIFSLLTRIGVAKIDATSLVKHLPSGARGGWLSFSFPMHRLKERLWMHLMKERQGFSQIKATKEELLAVH